MKSILSNILCHIVPFNDDDLSAITPCFKSIHVKKNTQLLRENEVCNHFYIIISGCIRTYFTDRNGTEKTRYIMPQYHMGTALTSFINQSPSFECMDVLSDAELYCIHHTDFFNLMKGMPHWQSFYIRILEMAYTFQTRKIESRITMNARQRFEQAMNENPELFQLVSNKVLASYLDMTPETLSRLKSR